MRRLVPLVAWLVAACAAPDGPLELAEGELAVVNGSQTSEYPSTAYFAVGQGFCSATLIGCSTVLTAAHCVCVATDDSPCASVQPAGPMTLFFQNGGLARVASVHVHPQYAANAEKDVAVLKLTAPVTGIKPEKLADRRWTPGDRGVVVGFGITGGTKRDHGLKRMGTIQTKSCDNNQVTLGDGQTITPPTTNTDDVCWDYPSSPSSFCHGDSGGPLYGDGPSGRRVVGVSHGYYSRSSGDATRCVNAYAWSKQVYAYRDFIGQIAGADLGVESCDALPQIGSPEVAVSHSAGVLDEATSTADATVVVPTGTASLRIAVNGIAQSGTGQDNQVELVVERDGQPASEPSECSIENGPIGMVKYCEIMAPVPGTYHLAVDRMAGAGDYQLNASAFAGAPTLANDSYRVDGPIDLPADAGVLANDAGRGNLTASVVQPPTKGELTLRADGSFRYQPGAAFDGEDRFVYAVADDGSYDGRAEVILSTTGGGGGDGGGDGGGGGGGGDDGDLVGGCATGGASGRGGLALAVLAALALVRRRTRPRA